jgi:hypothetical protein
MMYEGVPCSLLKRCLGARYKVCGFELSCWRSNRRELFDDYGNYYLPVGKRGEESVSDDVWLWGDRAFDRVKEWIKSYDFLY